jgi:uncharacterized protein (DUF362 family)/Pyruvate/2-oxoacid:ferredoxin oxidoreductase delta subunit
MKDVVSVIECTSYSQDKVNNAVKKAIDSIGGIEKFVKKNHKVLLKPNMLSGKSPEKHVTTHPSVVLAVINLVNKAGGIPYVGDSPGGGASTLTVAKKTKLYEICKKTKTEIIEFNNPVPIDNNKAKLYKRMVLEKTIQDMDLIINLPKLKTHTLTVITGAVKNLYGCIPGERKAQLHFKFSRNIDFNNMLLDIYSYIKPELTIMDGIRGMEGNGPSNGKIIKVGVIIAGTDCLAVDYSFCKITDIDLKIVPILKEAEKRNLFNKKNIQIKTDIKLPVVKFKLPHSASFNFIPDFIKNAFCENLVPKPKVKFNCIGCGVCKHNCPADAIKIKNNRANIDYSKCISCFCCQELCPEDAIKIKKSFYCNMFNFGLKLYNRLGSLIK